MAENVTGVDVSDILKFAVQTAASDVLLTVGSPPTVRINGELVPTNLPKLTAETSKAMVYSMLENVQIAKFEEKKDSKVH